LRKLLPFSLFLCARFLSAQSPTPTPISAIPMDPITQASRQLELLNRSMDDRSVEDARRAAIARDEEFARLQFLAKANQFVALWGDFASRLNEKQTFDVKLAKKLAKAFHELETSEGWPIRDQMASTTHGK